MVILGSALIFTKNTMIEIGVKVLVSPSSVKWIICIRFSRENYKLPQEAYQKTD